MSSSALPVPAVASKPTVATPKALALLAVALIIFGCIVAFTMYERAHDPDWWKHVGIRHERGAAAGGGDGPDDGRVIFLDDGNVFVAPRHVKKTPQPAPGGGAGGGAGGNAALSEDAKALRDGRPLNGRGALSRRLIDLAVKNGTQYIADYDVNVGPPACPVAPGKRAFNYIDVTSPNSTYVGVWLSHQPNVVLLPEFLSDTECAQIIAQASKSLFRSQVSPYKNSGASPVDDVRTSSQAWLSPSSGVAKVVVDRIMHLLSDFAPDAHEELQVLRYDIGQKYDAHNDYFDPRLYGKQANNRAVTIFLYLNDVEAGGFTVFPRAGGRPPPMEYKSCDKGLRVRPRRRDIALFYDQDCAGELDETSLHGGCPVERGVKWGGTLWVRH
jgi:prolyl 4-hydroxylase